jgi:hypothetical protein
MARFVSSSALCVAVVSLRVLAPRGARAFRARAATLSATYPPPTSPQAAAAAPEQIHISYTNTVGTLAVDFVAADATGYAAVSASAAGPFTQIASTSFN